MLRMPNCALTPGAFSVSSLASRSRGSNCAAACSKAGSIILQGPHHAAQKSTSTGMSLRVTCLEYVDSVSATDRLVNKGRCHCPQLGRSPSRTAGMRLIASQWGHTICSTSPNKETTTSSIARLPHQPARAQCADLVHEIEVQRGAGEIDLQIVLQPHHHLHAPHAAAGETPVGHAAAAWFQHAHFHQRRDPLGMHASDAAEIAYREIHLFHELAGQRLLHLSSTRHVTPPTLAAD